LAIPAATPDDENCDIPVVEPVVLPEPVRLRVVAMAADRLGALLPEEVPSSLRPHARFTPNRRARLAAGPIAAALEADPVFRGRVADGVREAMPELAAAVEAGRVPPAAAREDVGALAYLLRPGGWQSIVEEAATSLASRASAAASAGSAAMVGRLQEQLAAARRAGRAEAERLRVELTAARSEGDDLRRRLRDTAEQLRRAERIAAESRDQAAADRDAATVAGAAAGAESRRLKARLAVAEAAVEASRRAVREGRSADEVRLRLLLDTVVEAARGLRRELALPAITERPADLVAELAGISAGGLETEPARGLAADDPARLDWLLALPQTHLVVDGYNVTKLGYGGLPLEEQRGRLLRGLAALAAQAGIEVTCVFDGAERPAGVTGPTARNVRVLFSSPGEIADELIRRLVRAEPPGRPVVVVSSDREVADGVRRAGARAVPSAALLRRLDRA